MSLLLFLLFYRIGMIYNLPQFKVVVVVQSTSWPEVPIVNETRRNSMVELEISTRHVRSPMDLIAVVCGLLDTNSIDGLVMFLDCPSAILVQKQTYFRYLPSIVITRAMCYTDSVFNVQSCFHGNSALADIVGYKLWRNVLLFYDMSFDSHCLMDLVRKISQKSAVTRIVKISNNSINQQFVTKYSSDVGILVGSLETTTTILHQIPENELLKKAWVMMTGHSRQPKWNITSIRGSRVLFLRHMLQGFNSHGDCIQTEKSEHIVYVAESIRWFTDIFSQVVSTDNDTTLENLTGHQTAPLPNRTMVINTAKTILKQQTETFQICSSGKHKDHWTHMGTWSDSSGLNLEGSKLFNNEFINFENETLRVAALPLHPFVFMDQVDKNITTYRGFCIDILNHLALKYKFRYQIVSPHDNSYGSLTDDGTWNGMVGMVIRKEADFAAGPFTITSARASVIDFTTTYMEEGVGIITKRPQEEANKKYKMFKPLSLTVWLCIGASIIIVAIFLSIVYCLSPFSVEENEYKNNESIWKMVYSTLWAIYGSFMEQGDGPRPRSASGRIMMSFWWIFTILMLSTYTANLAAYLTVTIIDPPINSLEELASDDTLKPLIFSGANLHTLFKTSQSEVYRNIWRQMSGMPVVNDVNVALQYVREDDYAFLTDYSLLDYIMLQDCYTYAIADETFNNAGLGFVLQKDALYLDAFNKAIMKMTEGGFIEKWKRKWWPRTDSCSQLDKSGSAQSLGLDSVLGLFYMYFIVIGGATSVFVFEMFYQTGIIKRWKNLWKTRKTISPTN